jgi:hypothetical protein
LTLCTDKNLCRYLRRPLLAQPERQGREKVSGHPHFRFLNHHPTNTIASRSRKHDIVPPALFSRPSSRIHDGPHPLHDRLLDTPEISRRRARYQAMKQTSKGRGETSSYTRRETGSITEDLRDLETFCRDGESVFTSACLWALGFFFLSATALLGYPSSSLLLPLL